MPKDFRFRRGWSQFVVLLLIVASLGVLAFSYYMTRRLISRSGDYRASQLQSAVDAQNVFFKQNDGVVVSFTAQDGVRLAGIAIKRRNADATMVLCHGFRRGKEAMAEYVDLFPNKNILTFDFRACGQSQGDASSIGAHEYKDVLAAVAFARSYFNDDNIFIYGSSMGGAAAIKAAAQEPHCARALIIDSAYACLHEEIAHVFSFRTGLPYYPFFPVMIHIFYWLFGDDARHMRPLDYIEKITVPILLIHSATDSFTLPSHSVRLYAKAGLYNERARLWIGPPAGHTQLVSKYPVSYKTKVKHFVSRCLE